MKRIPASGRKPSLFVVMLHSRRSILDQPLLATRLASGYVRAMDVVMLHSSPASGNVGLNNL